MAKGIRISPKHGVNPSLDVCFWCGEARGVVLAGRIRKDGDNDAEAPREMVTSLEPCDKCKAQLAKGVHLIEVSDDGSRFGGSARFAVKAADGSLKWPTGRWVVLRPEAIKDGKPGGKALCDKETMDMILEAVKARQENCEHGNNAKKESKKCQTTT